MKRVLKALRLAALGLLALLLAGWATLALTGLPTPPAITAEGVPRIPWSRVWEMVSKVKEWQAVSRFAAWVPGRAEVLVGFGTARRVQRVASPGAVPEEIAGLPAAAYNVVIPEDPDAGFFVFALDDDHGSELYRPHRYDRATGTSQALTEEAARGGICCFEPGGERVAYASTERNGADFDLYLIDPHDPASVERVLEADGEYLPMAWSSDGRHIALLRLLSHRRSALHLLDVETGELTRLLADWGDAVGFESVEWDPAGGRLFFTSDHEAEFHRLRSYELATGLVTTFAEDIPWDVIDLALTPDGARVAFLVNEDSVPALHELDLTSGAWRRVEPPPMGFIRAQLGFEGLHMHPERAEVALDVTPPSGSTSVWSYDLDASEWTRWTRPGADENELPPVEIVRYPTFDLVGGEPRQIPAAVFRPPASYEPPHPVMIEIHGGPAMQAGPILPSPFVGVAETGIVVIRPNVRGSAGYGKSYQELDDRRNRPHAVQDIGALLDWIAEQPDLDSSRVMVMGGSYGGYMTLASLTRYSDRLRCGIDMFGISSLVTFLEASEEHHFPEAQRAEFGDERDPEMRAFLELASPLHHADRITVPLLIYQGANDIRVKPQESRQMVGRIRAGGGRVIYIEAADEGHNLSRPLNLLYVGAAYGEFLTECLLD